MAVYFGIRHFSPACAAYVLSFLERVQPETVLIEGPADGNEWIAPLCSMESAMPAALLAYTTEPPVQTVLWPFAEFSPEYQAMRWAVAHGVPVRFCDLPAACVLAEQSEASAPADAPAESVYGKMERVTGQETDVLWEYQFEQNENEADFLAAVEAYGASIREFSANDAHNQLREAYMRRVIAETEQSGVPTEKIAVITGASSGMGRRFAETVDSFDRFDEVWVIARHEKALEELRDRVPYPIRPLALDLTDRGSFQTYADALAEEPVEVGLLVNASGFGKFRAVVDTPLETNLNMVDLNCQAVMALCQLTVPYMPRGGQIINIASVAAFQPIPYINVYGATKAFVLSFSRALNRELRSQGVRVMALCPFWTRTAFFDRATGDGGESVVKKYVAMYEPEQLVRRAWRDAKRGKDVSQYGFVARFQAGLTKLLPHSLVMDVWMRQQKLQ